MAEQGDQMRETPATIGRLGATLRGAATAVRGFARNRRGVAALEFALIAPLLLTLYFVTMETSQAIEANKKIGRVASMVADLVAQQSDTTRTEVESIMRIGESIMQPYNRTSPQITVTQIYMTNEATPKARIEWSRRLANGSFSAGDVKNSFTTVPDKLRIANTYLIRVEAKLNYRPVITWTADQKITIGLLSAFDNIGMAERYYLRPRMSANVTCDTC